MKSLLFSLASLLALSSAACDRDGANPLGPSAIHEPAKTPLASEADWHAARDGKISLCHATGTERYVLITVSVQAQPAHRAHGDAQVGEPIPGQSGMIFSVDCVATPASTALSVTSGFVSFTEDELGGVTLSGNGFEVGFGWFPDVLSGSDETWWERCAVGVGCAPGTFVNFGTMIYGVSGRFLVPGAAVIRNVVYNAVFFDGQLTFRGPAGTLPTSVTPDVTGAVIGGPFEFEGRISAYADQTRSGAPVFSLHLVGSGQADADFYVNQGRFYSDTELRYRFAP